MCRQKDAKTVQGCALKTRSPCCAGAQNGEPPPLSPPQRRGTMGQESKYFLICKLWYLQAADPWLWLAGLSVCTEREGVPLPRSGGGWEGADAPAAPYKHRLAYAPGGRRPSGRAFRCVGVLGQRPKRVLIPFTRVKGTPRRRAVLTKFS